MSEMELRSIGPPFAVEVRGLDLNEPLAPEVGTALEEALHAHGLLLFRDQALSDDAQVRFMAQFGRFASGGAQDATGPATYMSSREGQYGVGEFDFHSDMVWTPYPVKVIALYGVEVPEEGGDTLFADAAGVLDRLPADLVTTLSSCDIRVTGGRGVQRVCPVIERHAKTGRPYINVLRARHRRASEGEWDELLGISPAEAASILDVVFGELYHADHIYRHQWRVGDLVLWDNRLLQHARTPFDPSQPRVLRRCALADDMDPDSVPLDG